ncbi:MAG: UDP-4-amino-4-deoxy-L-arabinose--oxoglutarate aminotransferase [Candidatus Argoarchaeum ethanivorans]|uniref:UDP-4-amino-4-deoxy-L-arabinose--oxoglutarate aminotransferase n=1 Tax=Candidatus Argoarchaeum ethanivorans TaxID=2608793 RepID=A0A811T6L8_9EURY|nr:MAG: UDP-4-amino-4-deoxy-L-arabinose--oxoglutarate aminotransferase [Candidatus Argoarchaeum ethanivorans]
MIPLMKNAFLNEYETKQALAEFIMKAPRLSMDNKCYVFEKEFAAFQGRNDSVLFNSGGSANLAMLQALKNIGRLKNGDKIGFSALTWSTNVMPIIQLGMEPVAVDCDPKTLNVMSHILNERLNSTDLQALFITNALGFTGDLDRIKQICDERGIVLIEDNCESLGTALHTGKAGNFSIASSFSFFVAHHMSTIEGGMVCTDDTELAQMLRIVRANGWDRNLTAVQQLKWRKNFNIQSEFDAKYTFYDLGYNLRPTEITGFIGLYQLKFIEENIAKRENNYMMLEAILRDNPDLIQLDHTHLKRLSSFAYPILCRTPKLRDKYIFQFSGAGIEIRPMIAGNIQNQPFYKKYVHNTFDLPGTDFIHNCGFYCGNYPELSESDLETLSSCLRKR